jgi:DNA-binding SARP family transcriptional activator
MKKSAVPLTIRLFGAPEIESHGRPLDLKNQKARALLFYLATTRLPHTRSHLATLLWSEFPSVNARRSLRVTLFQLRQSLNAAELGQTIIAEDDLLRLQLADNACDVINFLRLIDNGGEPDLTQAVALYRGPLLAGFDLPDTPLFDDWLMLEREKLALAYAGALKRLADGAESQGNWGKAIDYLRSIVQTDPLVEEAQKQLIHLYLKTGAISQGLRQYHQFEGELQGKLGLKPSPETRGLFQERLRLQQAPSSDEPVSGPGSRGRAQPALPVVGRHPMAAELGTVYAAIQPFARDTRLVRYLRLGQSRVQFTWECWGACSTGLSNTEPCGL